MLVKDNKFLSSQHICFTQARYIDPIPDRAVLDFSRKHLYILEILPCIHTRRGDEITNDYLQEPQTKLNIEQHEPH